jgi:hypothetical protein
MKSKLLVPAITLFLLASCSGNSETNLNSETDSTETLEITNADSVVIIEETELPTSEVIELSDDPYVIEEMLATIQSESTPGQNLSVVMSEDQNLYLEIGYDKTGKEESWIINLDIMNAFGVDVTVEFTDANHDDFKDELVIWWSESDGNNGLQNGFETSQSGLIIFDVMQRTEILNFVYSSHYSTYSAGQNANTDAPDYHAKMAEDSDWFICSYSHDIKLVDGEIHLSNYYSQTDGEGECELKKYADGIYTFNVGAEVYQLKK